MKLIKFNINELVFLGVCLGLIVFSLNHKFFGILRLLDFVLILLFGLFIFLKFKTDKKLIIIFFLIMSIFILSSYQGILKYGQLELQKLVFIYKYLSIFLIPLLIVLVLNSKKKIELINKLILINFIVLSCWAWLYIYIDYRELVGGPIRPSFPTLYFTKTMKSDAHVLSSYLGFFLSAYILYLRNFFNHSLVLSSLISINGLTGLLMTGGRTGILLILITFLAISIYKLKSILKIDHHFKMINFKKILSLLLILLFFIVLINSYNFNFYEGLAYFTQKNFNFDLFNFVKRIDYLIFRSLRFDFLSDPSSLSRVIKLKNSFQEVSHLGWVLGNGLKSEHIWYDGIFSMLIAHGGISMVLLCLVFYYLVIKKTYNNISDKKKFGIFLFLVGLYTLSNLITEHIMISRNAFPVLVFLSTLYASIKDNAFQNKS